MDHERALPPRRKCEFPATSVEVAVVERYRQSSHPGMCPEDVVPVALKGEGQEGAAFPSAVARTVPRPHPGGAGI